MTSPIPLLFGAQRKYPPNETMLGIGKQATELFLIESGCVRSWFNKDGVDITLQFFFEGETVTALESFLYGSPSDIHLETIEETEVRVLDRNTFLSMISQDGPVKDWFYNEAIRKLLVHTHRLLSLLQYKPLERYRKLLLDKDKILKRVPQRFIASYLGITPVSLSRIKHRK